MADQLPIDNFRSSDNTAAHATVQTQHETAHNLLADSFKMPEPKSVTANLHDFVEPLAFTAAGATAGGAAGVGMSAALGVVSAMTMPFLTRKSVSESMDLGFQYGLRTITPKYAAVGGLVALGAYELYHNTIGRPSDKK